VFIKHNNEYKGKLTFIVNKSNNNMTNVTDYVIELLKKTDLLACFDKWRKENASKTLNFAYWDMIIHEYLVPFFTHLVAVRISNFEARLDAWKCFTKYWFTYNHYLYAKMACHYLYEMHQCSDYLKLQMKQYVSASIPGISFTNLAFDEAIESSLDAKMYHTIEQITNLEENSNEVHVETITTRMKRDNDDLSTIMSTNVNPFRAQGSFVRLLTNITIPDDIVKKVLNSGSAGAHQTTDFITKRLLTTQENYDKRISNNKLRTLASFEPIPCSVPVIKKPAKKRKILLKNTTNK
ncbi:unnamed protein product, partial [Didymodactylos carnosus]